MISIIVAMDPTGLIGKDNELPWIIPSEIENFKKITTGNVVMMGRKTYQSIPEYLRPLPDRKNIVISKTCFLDNRYLGCEIYGGLHPALINCHINHPGKEIFICGGRSLYKQCLPFADRIYLSAIKGSYSGDVYFPLPRFSLPSYGRHNKILDYLKNKHNFTITRHVNQDEAWDFYLLERFPVYNTIDR